MAAAATNQNTSNSIYATDFSQPMDFAMFELLVEGKSLYVNAHMLAQVSPIFAKLCFGEGFKEKDGQRAVIADEKYEDILELLYCLLPNYSKGVIPKPITAANFVTIVRLADKFNIGALAATAEQFIDKLVVGSGGDAHVVLAMLDAAVRYHLSAVAIGKLIGRAATVAEVQLAAAAVGVDQWPSHVVKTLMVARLEHLKKRQAKHRQNTSSTSDMSMIIDPLCQDLPVKRARKGIDFLTY